MKRTLGIIGTVVTVYAAGFTIAWTAATSLATRKTKETLRGSRETFARISDEMVDCVLWYASLLIFDELGPSLKSVTVADAQRLAERLHIDELNIVNAKGVTVASNLPSEVGYVFSSNPVTAEFLTVLDTNRPVACFGQPYRPSTSAPHHHTKYYAAAFPDRSGFLELGFTLERLQRTYKQIDSKAYRNWRIGRYGHFEVVDRNGDGKVDRENLTSGQMPSEVQVEHWMSPTEGEVYACTFSYAGLLFRAVVPTREFHEQRNLLLTIGGISLAVILAFLTYLVVRLLASAEKLAVLHRTAEAHTAADLSLARVIQLSSLTHTELFRQTQLDCTFDAVTYPARQVGGDFYDVFERSDGRIVFLVADVSGKGVPAAIFMHIAFNAIKTAFRVCDDPSEAVVKINDYLCEHNEAEMFVTAWIGVLDPKSGAIEYVNAGHGRPYVIRSDARVERITGKGGLFLGAFRKTSYRVNRLKLGQGDRLFLYTDGVTEAMNGTSQTLGTARLEKVLAGNPTDVCEAVKSAVDAHVAGAERSDDLTMLLLSWHGEPRRVERTFPATTAALGEAVAFLRAELVFRHAKQATRLLNAVDEMMSNVVNYSRASTFTMTIEQVPGRCRVTLSDSGVTYNPLTHEDPDKHAPLAARPVGGLGILMTKKLVDSVTYRRERDRNVLTLMQLDSNGTLRQIS